MSVTLFHPVLDETITVERETKAAILERSGWQRVEPKDTPRQTYIPPRADEFVLETEDDDTYTEEV